MNISTLFTRRAAPVSLYDGAAHPSLAMKRQEFDGLPSTPPYSPLSDSCDAMDVPRLSLAAMPQEFEELPAPSHNRSTAIDAKHLSLPTKRPELPFTPPYSPLSDAKPLSPATIHMALDSMSDSGALLTVQTQKIGHELADTRENLTKVVELQQLLAKKQQRKLAKRNANWESRYDVMRREKEQQLAAQRALDERLRESNSKMDRLHTDLTEREQTLSAALEDSERKDKEMHHLHASLEDSRNAIEAHRQSLTRMRQELDELTRSRDELCDQKKGLEEKISTQASEAESLRSEIRELADSLSMVERKAADDLTDARRQMEKQASEIAAVQMELDGSLDDAANLRQELGSLQSDYDEKCSEFEEAVERHSADAQLKKQKIESLTMLLEEREVELAATQKELEGERQEILNVRHELGSLESDYDEVCSELDEAVRRHKADVEASRTRSEASEVELAAVQKELDNERGVIANIRQELSSLKSDYGRKCSELEEVTRRHEAEAQSLEKKLGEVKTTLDSETAGRRQLEKELNDARNEIMEKEQIIKSSSLSLDEVQKVVTELQNALAQQLELLEDDGSEEEEFE